MRSIKGETCDEKLKSAIEIIAIYKYDKLTELKGRFDFDYEFQLLFDSWKKNNTNFTLSIIDLNGLKIVNDLYGHLKGDELIIKISKLLKEVFDENNLYRIGGDEFALLCTSSHKETCSSMKKLLSENKGLFCYGIVSSSMMSHSATLSDVFNFADNLMLNAKIEYKEKMMS